MDVLYKDLSLRCPEVNITDINVINEDFLSKGKVVRFVFNGKHYFDQIYYSKRTYEENLENTIVILNEKIKEIEDESKRIDAEAKNKN